MHIQTIIGLLDCRSKHVYSEKVATKAQEGEL